MSLTLYSKGVEIVLLSVIGDLKRRSRGVVKTMIKCALDVSENLKNSNIVDKTRGVHELTNHTYDM